MLGSENYKTVHSSSSSSNSMYQGAYLSHFFPIAIVGKRLWHEVYSIYCILREGEEWRGWHQGEGLQMKEYRGKVWLGWHSGKLVAVLEVCEKAGDLGMCPHWIDITIRYYDVMRNLCMCQIFLLWRSIWRLCMIECWQFANRWCQVSKVEWAERHKEHRERENHVALRVVSYSCPCIVNYRISIFVLISAPIIVIVSKRC